MKPCILAVVIATASAQSVSAQSLAKNVVAADGQVEVIYPSRPDACGDGQTFIGNILGPKQMYVDDGSSRTRWGTQPCIHGPARVAVTVIDGEVTRLRAFVGPAPSTRTGVRVVNATASEASTWLGDLVSRASARVASQAVVPLVLADGPEPWPLLLKVARDDNRPREVKRSAMLWLSSGVSHRLGIDDLAETDEDEMRKQAVFVLAQQRRSSESVPELIDLARNNTHPAVRRDALFWLSQTEDRRAVDLYAELLRIH